MRWICCAGLLLFVTFFESRAQKVSFTEKRSSFLTYVKGSDFEGVIFSKDFAFPFLSDDVAEKRFTPTEKEIESAELVLLRDIRSVNTLQKNQGGENGPVVHESLKSFVRQYFGYYTSAGEKVVYISFLLKAHYKPSPKETPNWLKGAVFVLNGGSNYWQVQANLNKSCLFGLDINGVDRSALR